MTLDRRGSYKIENTIPLQFAVATVAGAASRWAGGFLVHADFEIQALIVTARLFMRLLDGPRYGAQH